MLFGVVATRLEAFPLFVSIDVQIELENRCSFFREHPFEIVDLGVTTLPDLAWDQFADPSNSDILIVAAVKDDDFTLAGHVPMDSP